jgi:hypothetical protein
VLNCLGLLKLPVALEVSVQVKRAGPEHPKEDLYGEECGEECGEGVQDMKINQ